MAERPRRKRTILLVVLALILALGVGFVSYYLYIVSCVYENNSNAIQRTVPRAWARI